MTAKSLASNLRSVGVNVLSIEERTSSTDAEVGLEKDLAVQISYGRYCLNHTLDTVDDFVVTHLGVYTSFRDLVKAIKQ